MKNNNTDKRINVTKSFIPPIDEYKSIVERAFNNEWLTNRGVLVLELEASLKEYLGVNQMTLHTNGTLPIQIALKALGITKEVITTPFSYVATTSAIIWEGATPVFADIDKEHWTICPQAIEKKITAQTQAILATHVFGNPCDVVAINELARKYNLMVIYDGAHAFGVQYNGKSIFNYGNVSTCSFHATKLFHTGEGGASFCNDASLEKRLFYHHNFGHNGPEEFHGLGINSKMSELQAAMGLAVLPHVDIILTKRKEICELYEQQLGVINVQFIKWRTNSTRNYAYFPVFFATNEIMDDVKKALEAENIFPRRYFYPSLNTLPYLEYTDAMPSSESLCSSILCLPLSHDLSREALLKITGIIKNIVL